MRVLKYGCSEDNNNEIQSFSRSRAEIPRSECSSPCIDTVCRCVWKFNPAIAVELLRTIAFRNISHRFASARSLIVRKWQLIFFLYAVTEEKRKEKLEKKKKKKLLDNLVSTRTRRALKLIFISRFVYLLSSKNCTRTRANNTRVWFFFFRFITAKIRCKYINVVFFLRFFTRIIIICVSRKESFARFGCIHSTQNNTREILAPNLFGVHGEYIRGGTCQFRIDPRSNSY